MIARDQPTIFGDRCIVALSSVEDGSMKEGSSVIGTDAIQKNYETFLRLNHLNPTQTTYMTLTLDDYLTGNNFTRYRSITDDDTGKGPLSPVTGFDGLAMNQSGRALAIPPADCPVAVIYDPTHHALMLSHLGRHSVEQFSARKSVEFMAREFGSRPADLLVWLSPSPNGDVYPMWAFDNRSMRDVCFEQLASAGVPATNIEVSPVDTVTNLDYFSHSEYLKGHRDTDGRYGIVAALV